MSPLRAAPPPGSRLRLSRPPSQPRRTPAATTDGVQPAKGAGSQTPAPAAQSSQPPINQLRKAPAKSGPSKPAQGKQAQGKPAQGKQAGNGAAKPASSAAAPKAAAKGGSGSNGSGGGLRRLVKGRAEPEPPAPEPETKIVRQQPVRQSRSRRSGKR